MTTDKTDILRSWMREIDGYFLEMVKFSSAQPEEIFVRLSAWTARASHIRSQINRSESKIFQNFRIKQIDPFISECDRQFKMWSRVFAVYTLDYNIEGRGQV